MENNKKLRCYIVEDEPKNLKLIIALLEDYCKEWVEIIGYSQSVKQAVEEVPKLQIDLLYLDIELSDGNGFDVLNQIDFQKLSIIFTTAYSEFAIKAIKYGALDYLLKPLNLEELKSATKRAVEEHTIVDNSNITELQKTGFENEPDWMMLKDNHKYQKVLFKEISFLTADGAYTNIYLLNGTQILSSKNIGHFTDILPEQMFFRCHKSYLVNLSLMEKYDRTDGIIIHMPNNKQIQVATRKRDEFLSRVGV